MHTLRHVSTPTTAAGATVLVASNRGPVAFTVTDDGRLDLDRGGGGLVSGLSAVAHDQHALWVCTALSTADRRAAREAPGGRLDRDGHDTDGTAVRMLDIDPATFHRAYNVVANSTLWFVHHHLFDTANTPQFDRKFRREWDSYVAYGEAFAGALADEAAPGATVVVQDYHLTLTPRMLREKRPDLRIGHFSHTPWAAVDYFRLLPDDVAREVLLGMLGADHAGFLSPRWARAFMECCAGAARRRRSISTRGRSRSTVAARRSASIRWASTRPRCASGQRKQMSRPGVPRSPRPSVTERYFCASTAPSCRRTSCAASRPTASCCAPTPSGADASCTLPLPIPSRHDLPEYREYTAAVQRIAAEIEDEFATDDWTPLDLAVNDDYPRSLAAYRIADVLVVNPIRDGMNLVAKEGPVLSERGVALVLSREAGAAAELGADALLVNPFDVSATAEAMHAALSMPVEERAARSRRLVAAATALPPQQWFADQVAALRG